MLGIDDAERADGRQSSALAPGQLVDTLPLNDQFPLLAVGKIDMTGERIVVAVSNFIAPVSGATAPIAIGELGPVALTAPSRVVASNHAAAPAPSIRRCSENRN